MVVRSSRLEALTGLRFFAALLVLGYHVWPGPTADDVSRPFYKAGYIGVSLFFVLSGFILGYNYLAKAGQIKPRDFYCARLARIYPIYFVGVAMAFAYECGVFGALRAGLRAGVQLPLGQAWLGQYATVGNGVGWSLSVEVFFYALFPWLAKRISQNSIRKAVALIALSAVLSVLPQIFYVVRFYTPDVNIYNPTVSFFKFFPLLRLPEFVIGVSLAQAHRLRRAEIVGPKADLIALSSLATICVLAFSPWRLPWPLLVGGGLALPMAGLIFGLTNDRSLLGRALALKPIVFLGEASFALYIVHYALFLALLRYFPQLPGFALVATVSSVMVACLAHVGIERPARNMLLRWSRGKQGASGPPPHLTIAPNQRPEEVPAGS